MARIVLYMAMSLAGFIAGPDDGMEHGLGVGGDRLHAWLRDGGSTRSHTGARPGRARQYPTR